MRTTGRISTRVTATPALGEGPGGFRAGQPAAEDRHGHFEAAFRKRRPPLRGPEARLAARSSMACGRRERPRIAAAGQRRAHVAVLHVGPVLALVEPDRLLVVGVAAEDLGRHRRGAPAPALLRLGEELERARQRDGEDVVLALERAVLLPFLAEVVHHVGPEAAQPGLHRAPRLGVRAEQPGERQQPERLRQRHLVGRDALGQAGALRLGRAVHHLAELEVRAVLPGQEEDLLAGSRGGRRASRVPPPSGGGSPPPAPGSGRPAPRPSAARRGVRVPWRRSPRRGRTCRS